MGSNTNAAPEESSERIERLLVGLRASVGPVHWPQIEELLCALMNVYSNGLSRLFECMQKVDALDDRARTSLADDALVASLLRLHGLHPLSAEVRIRDALEEITAQLGPIALIRIEVG